MSKQIDPSHFQKQAVLRTIGPVVIAIGALFGLVGFVDFFSSFGSFRPPQYFWCLFVGLPLVSIGTMMTKAGYLGVVSRYMADEVAPVGKDVANYMIQETKGSVQDLAKAVGQGVITGMNSAGGESIRCQKCDLQNDGFANFCKACGSSLIKSKSCNSCREMNDGDARFCNRCGTPMA